MASATGGMAPSARHRFAPGGLAGRGGTDPGHPIDLRRLPGAGPRVPSKGRRRGPPGQAVPRARRAPVAGLAQRGRLRRVRPALPPALPARRGRRPHRRADLLPDQPLQPELPLLPDVGQPRAAVRRLRPGRVRAHPAVGPQHEGPAVRRRALHAPALRRLRRGGRAHGQDGRRVHQRDGAGGSRRRRAAGPDDRRASTTRTTPTCTSPGCGSGSWRRWRTWRRTRSRRSWPTRSRSTRCATPPGSGAAWTR